MCSHAPFPFHSHSMYADSGDRCHSVGYSGYHCSSSSELLHVSWMYRNSSVIHGSSDSEICRNCLSGCRCSTCAAAAATAAAAGCNAGRAVHCVDVLLCRDSTTASTQFRNICEFTSESSTARAVAAATSVP
uniref:Alanine--tRNA ligase n=1 Tax=Lygus hesperus TaxID=30085 RepID=A0A0A9YHR8_LYGHE